MLKFLILFLLLPGVVLASKGGGGGLVVACYNGDELTKVELLDLYEGRVKGIKYSELSGNWEKDVQDLAIKIAKDEENAKFFVSTLNRIVSSYKLIPEDSELESTNDAFPPFLPRGCKAKQVANYYNDRLVWIDSVLFNKMNYQGQLALAFHETIYYMERIFRPDSDSRYTRNIVSHLFGQKEDFDPPKSENYDFYCTTTGESNKPTSFLARKIEGSEVINFEFSFIMLNGHYAYTQKIAQLNVNPQAIEKEQGDIEAPEPYLISSSDMLSRINYGEKVIVSSNSNRLILSWHGTDPGDTIRGAKVQCYKHHQYINIFPFMLTDVK